MHIEKEDIQAVDDRFLSSADESMRKSGSKKKKKGSHPPKLALGNDFKYLPQTL